MTTTAEVLVFRTDIGTEEDLERVSALLNHLHHISRWTIDMEDVDKVLRIETGSVCAEEIIELVTNAGYRCGEL